ncbi:hypothetical protein [Pseudonocardia spinosispora]|uniref:hypothetical protein n=1 Tax=Pseudonocardia spinosispora TaxID=103441 RepID=UPI001B7FE10E|nr:hypothetical protein [Pseudonocardia spinosispora]
MERARLVDCVDEEVRVEQLERLRDIADVELDAQRRGLLHEPGALGRDREP